MSSAASSAVKSAVAGAEPGGALRWLDTVRKASGPVRFRQYTQYTIYSLALIEIALLAFWLVSVAGSGDPRMAPQTTAVLTVLFAAHAATVTVLVPVALRCYLGTADRPRGRIVTLIVVTAALLSTVFALVDAGRVPESGVVAAAWTVMFAAGPLLLALPIRHGTLLLALLLTGAELIAVALGLPGYLQAGLLAAAGIGAPILGFSFRGSGWTLKVVDELVAARETQARLAVAEERLRFGRDLHDVLGRNLSVIALKSELAAQLARRGSSAAEAQMVEVQRIARESQQEVREVVRGYREADLHTELAGARGVLRAAGIDCRIEDTGVGGLPEAIRSALGWVVREGATNVLRHADAGDCVIRVGRTSAHDAGRPAEAGGTRSGTAGRRTRRGTQVLLVMENDGVPEHEDSPAPKGGTRAAGRADGVPGAPGDAAGAGSGLVGLRERLAALGGTVHAERLPGGRFRLTARVPLAHPERAEESGGSGEMPGPWDESPPEEAVTGAPGTGTAPADGPGTGSVPTDGAPSDSTPSDSVRTAPAGPARASGAPGGPR